MTDHYITDEDMAERIGKSKWFVQERCRGKNPAWPHQRVGKSIRFTPEQVATIDGLLAVGSKAALAPTAAELLGRRGRTA
jgi:hypothetical protein